MSVLESIKGRLHHVQEDIKASFRSLTSKERPGLVLSTTSGSDGISVDAGADILNKFQQNWIEIHQKSEENAKLAEEVDDQVSTIFIHCEKQSKQLNQLQAESVTLGQIMKDIELVNTQLSVLNDSFGKIEHALLELEDMCEAQEMEQNKKKHRIQLTKYDETKKAELEHIKVKLAQEHASKVQETERKRAAMLKDRQDVFEEAFVSDLEHYKLTGRTERISVASSFGSQSDHQMNIADINLDDDVEEKGALDAFLDDEPVALKTDSTTPIIDELESAMNEDDDEDDTTPPIDVKADEDLTSDCEILDKPEEANMSKGSDQNLQSKSPSETSWECVNNEKFEDSPPKT